jgi:hypothetical protein
LGSAFLENSLWKIVMDTETEDPARRFAKKRAVLTRQAAERYEQQNRMATQC